MYCVCRDRMKKNRTSWSVEGAETWLMLIMSKMNGTIVEIITKKAEERIKEKLGKRIPEPTKVKKIKQGKIVYAGKYEIANNYTGRAKDYILRVLKTKKWTELMITN